MKKVLLVALLLAGSAPVALAQNNVIKVNIISPLVRTGSFFYERKLTDNSSLQFGALVTNARLGILFDDDLQVTGFALTPEYRFYLSESKVAPEGFYVGPYLRYQNLTLKVDNTYTEIDANGNPRTVKETDEASLNTFGGGILVGRQWIFKERFSLDLFLGPAYNAGSITVKSNSANREEFDPGPFDGFGIRTGITFGIAF